jgi:hypothetical protein
MQRIQLRPADSHACSYIPTVNVNSVVFCNTARA